MPPEVLIYVQNIKNLFEKNDEIRNYFLEQIDEEEFFEHLAEISQKNLETEGEPNLTKIQLELIKRTLIAKGLSEKNYEDDLIDEEKDLYFNTNGFGRVYLN